MISGTWWRIGWVDDFQPEGRGFDSRSSRHVGTLGKSLTCSCLCASAWNSGTISVLCRERFWVVVGLKGRYRNSQNEWMNDEDYHEDGDDDGDDVTTWGTVGNEFITSVSAIIHCIADPAELNAVSVGTAEIRHTANYTNPYNNEHVSKRLRDGMNERESERLKEW